MVWSYIKKFLDLYLVAYVPFFAFAKLSEPVQFCLHIAHAKFEDGFASIIFVAIMVFRSI